jgi:hypothetical protein
MHRVTHESCFFNGERGRPAFDDEIAAFGLTPEAVNI